MKNIKSNFMLVSGIEHLFYVMRIPDFNEYL